MICSDGTHIGRDPSSNCEFESCPTGTQVCINSWMIVAEGDYGDSGCSQAYDVYLDNTFVEQCQEYCRDYEFMQHHENHFCGCFSECDFARPASSYGSTADVYERCPVTCPADTMMCSDGSSVSRDPASDCEFEPCPTEEPCTSFFLVAQGSMGEPGCSETYDKHLEGGNILSVEYCQGFCIDYEFLQYHENRFCGCFSECDFTRAASSYGSIADVYQRCPTETTETPDYEFELVGFGWCRPSASECYLLDSDCRVNGMYKGNSNEDECESMCRNNMDKCTGYAISSPDYSAHPNRCYVYGTFGRLDSAGWTWFPQSYTDVVESNGLADVYCYKLTTTQLHHDPTSIPTSSLQTTFEPTSIPTRISTTSTSDPTRIPTRLSTIPTSNPTHVPITSTTLLTSGPSYAPTCSPTKSPTQSPIKPTMQPTSQPSSHPSAVPTFSPSYAPTCSPTKSPTQSPIKPTMQPTSQPSFHPSEMPTSIPSYTPTRSPSKRPSKSPIHPTMQPTSQPSFHPSVMPTSSPSHTPTCSPTKCPTQSPINPTMQPSSQPSLRPSFVPSSIPTLRPTTTPNTDAQLDEQVSLIVQVEGVQERNKRAVCNSVARALSGMCLYVSLSGPSNSRRLLNAQDVYMDIAVEDLQIASNLVQSEGFLSSLEVMPPGTTATGATVVGQVFVSGEFFSIISSNSDTNNSSPGEFDSINDFLIENHGTYVLGVMIAFISCFVCLILRCVVCTEDPPKRKKQPNYKDMNWESAYRVEPSVSMAPLSGGTSTYLSHEDLTKNESDFVPGGGTPYGEDEEGLTLVPYTAHGTMSNLHPIYDTGEMQDTGESSHSDMKVESKRGPVSSLSNRRSEGLSPTVSENHQATQTTYADLDMPSGGASTQITNAVIDMPSGGASIEQTEDDSDHEEVYSFGGLWGKRISQLGADTPGLPSPIPASLGTPEPLPVEFSPPPNVPPPRA